MQNRLDSLKAVNVEMVAVVDETISLPQDEEFPIIRYQPVFENDAINSILPYLIIFYTLILTQLLVFYLLGRTVKKQKTGEFSEGLETKIWKKNWLLCFSGNIGQHKQFQGNCGFHQQK